MILTGSEIKKMLDKGRLHISPFDETRLQPNSYDLTLDYRYALYEDYILDPKTTARVSYHLIPNEGMVLYPGMSILGSTMEECGSDEFVCHVDGKSSIGRMFLQIHCTAGRGDLGFQNQWTLEMTVVGNHAVRIYPKMKIAQAAFYSVLGDREIQYQGKYKYQNGPTPSLLYKEKESEYVNVPF